jgi:hypothetical protein
MKFRRSSLLRTSTLPSLSIMPEAVESAAAARAKISWTSTARNWLIALPLDAFD